MSFEKITQDLNDLPEKLHLLRTDQEFLGKIGVDPNYLADMIYQYLNGGDAEKFIEAIIACDDPRGEAFPIKKEAALGRFKVVGQEVLLNGMRAFELAFRQIGLTMPPDVKKLYEEKIKEKFDDKK